MSEVPEQRTRDSQSPRAALTLVTTGTSCSTCSAKRTRSRIWASSAFWRAVALVVGLRTGGSLAAASSSSPSPSVTISRRRGEHSSLATTSSMWPWSEEATCARISSSVSRSRRCRCRRRSCLVRKDWTGEESEWDGLA